MTPEVRSRSPFELRRFTAAAVSADLAVVDLEGRFEGVRGRFTRQPVLVVEEPGAPRAELAPVRARLDGDRWRSSFAVPLDAVERGAFALGVRGVLYDLPRPRVLADGDRLALVAREANALRRRVEALEAERDAARAEAEQAYAGREEAVTAAHGEAAAAAAQRIADLEEEVAVARRVAEADVAAARQSAEAEIAAAQAEVAAAQSRADGERGAAVEGVQQELRDQRERAEVAEARAAAAEERERHEAAGADVLRAELAEERERAQAAIAELQDRLAEVAGTAHGHASRGGEPTRPLTPPPPPSSAADEPATTVAPRGGSGPETNGAGLDTDTETDDDPDEDDSRPIPLRQAPLPHAHRPEAPAEPIHHHGPSLSPWIAVVALGVFAFLVVALVLGLLS